ncbi:hypothetical protein SAMN03080598_02863 [Algoriphagus boritolerans DSM 17298 = JCM 18970]|uniref:Uncharacterized protein n=1 Tax=Algoriphagus boritolerans DSM 17298 = JCM 18970 TaxID=1120964 RepID=A0A1H5Y8J5_9BACT|nr:hypothetical protein SAMN03080598_02863 [Algoriphagus boritolerans DSM 17298 = JCM 18970]
MPTIEKIRNGLIDKILSIQNKDFLEALDKIISSVYNLFFKGQIACPDFSSGESRMHYNHPSV